MKLIKISVFIWSRKYQTNYSGLKNEKYDLALCSYVENEPEIEFIPITQQELVMIVPPHHPLAKKESIDLKEVSEYPFISFNKESGVRKLIDALFDEN